MELVAGEDPQCMEMAVLPDHLANFTVQQTISIVISWSKQSHVTIYEGSHTDIELDMLMLPEGNLAVVCIAAKFPSASLILQLMVRLRLRDISTSKC